MTEPKKISIFDYLNYRRYLGDMFRFLKDTEGVTLRAFSRQAGFNSHSFLKQIIDGTKSASVASAWKIAQGFGLTNREAEYLELLIKFSAAKSLPEKNEIYKKIAKWRPKDKVTKIEREHYELFANWYVMAIREMVTMSGFREDFDWIAQNLQPKITRTEAKNALGLLLKHKFLDRDKHGRLIQADAELTTGTEVDSLYILNYHTNLMHVVAESMQTSSELWRDISSLSFVVDRDEFSYIKQRVQEFRAELLQYVKDTKKPFTDESLTTDSHLYYLNIQLFNASKVNWKPKQGTD